MKKLKAIQNSMVRPFSFGPTLLHITPKLNFINRIATAYSSWFAGENNVWADTNGEFWALSKFIPRAKVVFDVGSNVGDWTRRALEINPQLEIHCFEAATDNYQTLIMTDLNATFNNVAVSDNIGFIELCLYGENSPFNSIVSPDRTDIGEASHRLNIPAITLDEYARQNMVTHIDFIKIDVEGAEGKVLLGMSKLLSKDKVDIIQFEHGRFSIYAKTLIKDYFDFMNNNNFAMFKLVQESLHYHEHYRTSIENFNHQNWLCIRKNSPYFSTAIELSKAS